MSSPAAPAGPPRPGRPRPVFDHLRRLTDDRGLFEHADHGTPRPEHGYCVDDAARGLVVGCREPDPEGALLPLVERYLELTLSALDPDGACHNRLGLDGAWTDRAGTGDWWGRAVWGLGVAAAQGPTAAVRSRARAGFTRAAQARTSEVRSAVFAGLGAAELVLVHPWDTVARSLLRDCLELLPPPGTAPDWPWPEPRLRYGNASIVELLLLGGAVLADPAVTEAGVALLDFLLRVETHDGHLSVTPVGGRGPGETGPAFDQQPIEVAALADACARAYDLTGDTRWAAGVELAWAWFTGDNDSGVALYDERTGAGYDGLEPGGRNLNQGAESTLAALSTAQQARALHDRDLDHRGLDHRGLDQAEAILQAERARHAGAARENRDARDPRGAPRVQHSRGPS